jgi:hypothetical protein
MNAPYLRLCATLALGACAMFLVLHLTIGLPASRVLDLGLLCLALMLVAPVGVLILLFMPHIFRRFGANLAFYTGLALLFLGAYQLGPQGALSGDQTALHGHALEHLARS